MKMPLRVSGASLLEPGRPGGGGLAGAAAAGGARADAVAVPRAPALGHLASDRVVAAEDDVDGVLDAHALVRVHRDAVAEREVRVRLEAHLSSEDGRKSALRRVGPTAATVEIRGRTVM